MKELSKISSLSDRKAISKIRGESDQIAIKLKYHDPKIHSILKPSSDLPSQIFNLAEDTRIESVGGTVSEDLFGDSNIYATCQNDDDLSWVLKYSGSKSLIIGTDYGHTDPSTQIDAISIFRNREDLDQYNKNNILSNNPKRLYGI